MWTGYVSVDFSTAWNRITGKSRSICCVRLSAIPKVNKDQCKCRAQNNVEPFQVLHTHTNTETLLWVRCIDWSVPAFTRFFQSANICLTFYIILLYVHIWWPSVENWLLFINKVGTNSAFVSHGHGTSASGNAVLRMASAHVLKGSISRMSLCVGCCLALFTVARSNFAYTRTNCSLSPWLVIVLTHMLCFFLVFQKVSVWTSKNMPCFTLRNMFKVRAVWATMTKHVSRSCWVST